MAETGSTNADVRDAALAGAVDGLVIAADYQSAGRGRLDRRWIAPAGASLLVSVLVRSLAVERWHLSTMAMSLAAADACRSVAGVGVDIRWPNDLYVGDRKLAGMLAEGQVTADPASAFVVVGIGINVNWPQELPDEIADRAIALNHVTRREIDRRALLEAVLAGLSGTDWDTVTDRYRSRLSSLGRNLTITMPRGDVVRGRAVDLDADGALVVETADGERRVVTVGDVS